jgi:putative transposase
MSDNAHIETFFHSLKSEGLFSTIFTSTEQLMHAVDSYVSFYNTWGLHSSIGYLSPVNLALTCQAKNLPN